jgi:2-oxoglutarate dehydrogenase E1 component
MNLPYKKPLIMFTPKYLLHHRPCTSALGDLASSTFFNRVIGDGKKSDNLRHLISGPDTGVGDASRKLVPPLEVRRVVLCSGQVRQRQLCCWSRYFASTVLKYYPLDITILNY